MKATETHGMRMFLLTLVKLAADGKKEKSENVEELIRKGVASVLTSKYSEFRKDGFDPDNAENIDAYFRETWRGSAEGNEHKYNCGEDDGLILLFDLVLNDFS